MDQGMQNACCKNQLPPDRLLNEHKFPKTDVDVACTLMNRWFSDTALGMCRVVEFGGYNNRKLNQLQPVMFYDFLLNGELNCESSTFSEVAQWVGDCKDNI